MKNNIVRAATLAASLCAFTAANASTTVGSVTVDSFADQGGVAQGSFNSANILDGSFGTTETLNSNDVLRFSFSSGAVVNGTGADLYVFEGYSLPENTALSLTLGGTLLNGSFVETVFGVPGALAQVNIYAFDLSGLGIAAGTSFAGDLFLTRASSGPDVYAIGAASTAVASAVPLPAAGWMLLAGLGGMGVMRRRKTSS